LKGFEKAVFVKLIKKNFAIFLIAMLLLPLMAIKPVTADGASLTEGQFLNMLMKQYAATDLGNMPKDGTYKYAKEYHLAKRLGLPVIGTAYTSFGDDKLSRKNAAKLIAQAFTGKLLTEKQSIEWMFSQKLVTASDTTYEVFRAEDFLTKMDAEQFLSGLKQKGFKKLIKTPSGKIGKYRVDSFFKPIKTYNTYDEAYAHAKRYSYTKVVDTATGMVLWYPKKNTKILYHLHVDGKWAAGFDTEANALVYVKKLENHFSRIIEGIMDYSVWDNYNHYAVKNAAGGKALFKTLDEAYLQALRTDGEKSIIHPVDDDVNKYKHAFLSQKSANIQNGVLIFNGYEVDKKKKGKYELDYDGLYREGFFRPYIAYEKNGKYIDTFFDTFIISARYYSDQGRFEETATNHANYKEWEWYKERTFKKNGVMDILNRDVANHPNVNKVKVYVAIPYPRNEGNLVKLDGKTVKADHAGRYALVKWYTDEVMKKFTSGKYPHLQFEGFYWLNETVISKDDEKLVTAVGKLIHSKKKRFIFSPHSQATNYRNWKKYGFDAAYFQSNGHKVTDPSEIKKRLHWGYMNSYSYGMGVNLEIEDTDHTRINNLMNYFDQYMELGNRYRVPGSSTIMYQGTVMINRLGKADIQGYQEQYRDYYDKIYRFLKNKPEPIE
jgi:hypothetical protein